MNMRNISKCLKEVISRDVNWQFSIFYDVVEALENDGFDTSFWEGEENWALISYNDEGIGYIWKKYPLIILEKDKALLIKKNLKNINVISYIEPESIDNDLYRIDDNNLKSFIDIPHDIIELTMNDLWFYTNSI